MKKEQVLLFVLFVINYTNISICSTAATAKEALAATAKAAQFEFNLPPDPVIPAVQNVQSEQVSLSTFISYCENLPFNRSNLNLLQEFNDVSGTVDFFYQIPFAVSRTEFETTLDNLLMVRTIELRNNESNWLIASNGQLMPEQSSDLVGLAKFSPFVQKVIGNKGSRFYMHGDLHGDIASFAKQLQSLYEQNIINDDFQIIQPDVYLVFLGDYVDRGMFGTEVLYAIMRLYLANPNGHVIIVRGNHEDTSLNSSFARELRMKFMDFDQRLLVKIGKMYELLPLAFYVGCKDTRDLINYIQCCHGGLEEAYDPRVFLDDERSIYQLMGSMPITHACKGPLEHGKDPFGFMWHDFDTELDESHDTGLPVFNEQRMTGYIHGELATKLILHKQSSKKSIVRGVIRAHQHSQSSDDNMMRHLLKNFGLYKLWRPDEGAAQVRRVDDGLVWTLNAPPDSMYGAVWDYDYDAYMLLTVEREYVDWKITLLLSSFDEPLSAFPKVKQVLQANKNESFVATCFDDAVHAVISKIPDFLQDNFRNLVAPLQLEYERNGIGFVDQELKKLDDLEKWGEFIITPQSLSEHLYNECVGYSPVTIRTFIEQISALHDEYSICIQKAYDQQSLHKEEDKYTQQSGEGLSSSSSHLESIQRTDNLIVETLRKSEQCKDLCDRYEAVIMEIIYHIIYDVPASEVTEFLQNLEIVVNNHSFESLHHATMDHELVEVLVDIVEGQLVGKVDEIDHGAVIACIKNIITTLPELYQLVS